MSDVPSVRLLAGKEAEPLLMHTVHRRTGAARWQLLKTAALRDSDGQMAAAVTVIEDVTAVKTAEVHTRVLAKSGRILASSLDYEQTLRNVAQVAVPGAGRLVHGRADRRAAAPRARWWSPIGAASAKLADPAAAGLRARASSEPDSASAGCSAPASPSCSSRSPTSIWCATLAATSTCELMRELDVRSAVVVPMRVPDADDRRDDVRHHRVAAPADAGRRRAGRAARAPRGGGGRELAAAHRAEPTSPRRCSRACCPASCPTCRAGRSRRCTARPAPSSGSRSAATSTRCSRAGSSSFALIGDVTGHGVTAATLTSLMRYGARFASRLEPQPAAILRRLDEELRRRAGDALCTALCAAAASDGTRGAVLGRPPAGPDRRRRAAR